MNAQLAGYVFDRARLDCALGPKVARALGVPAKIATQLTYGTPAQARRMHHAVASDALFEELVAPELSRFRHRYGIAVGKGAETMMWGAGAMTAGVCITNHAVTELPSGWRAIEAPHPHPDERSEAAARAVRELVDERATDEDVVVALISGGASAMLEEPRVPLAELRAIVAALMAAGAPIEELNVVRTALSSIKGGQLALDCGARIITLVASDVVDDPLALVGSGPTIGPWLECSPADVGALAEQRRTGAIAILERHGLAVPDALRGAIPSRLVTRGDRASLVSGMKDCAYAMVKGLKHQGVNVRMLAEPMRGDARAIADRLAAEPGPVLAWGEPTLQLPATPGEGGRMQQLALELARRIAGSRRCVFAIGSDGADGPAPVARPQPAGAFVDGATWGSIVAAGLDPERALARCDAGTALDRVGALVITGPTHINHADIVVVV